MFNFVFNVEHEWYKYFYRGADITFFNLLKLQLKIFANIFAISLAFTLPICFMMFGAYYLDLL
tara:strand:+ start:3670 stop:3858 length:189 start_codon:yes stop_codon:yes gene_type:complete